MVEMKLIRFSETYSNKENLLLINQKFDEWNTLWFGGRRPNFSKNRIEELSSGKNRDSVTRKKNRLLTVHKVDVMFNFVLSLCEK